MWGEGRPWRQAGCGCPGGQGASRALVLPLGPGRTGPKGPEQATWRAVGRTVSGAQQGLAGSSRRGEPRWARRREPPFAGVTQWPMLLRRDPGGEVEVGCGGSEGSRGVWGLLGTPSGQEQHMCSRGSEPRRELRCADCLEGVRVWPAPGELRVWGAGAGGRGRRTSHRQDRGGAGCPLEARGRRGARREWPLRQRLTRSAQWLQRAQWCGRDRLALSPGADYGGAQGGGKFLAGAGARVTLPGWLCVLAL